MWGVQLTDIPLIAGTVVTLVFLEGLLSADNALVLAVMVRHLPRAEQRRALRYGLGGAVIFRAIAVALSAVLLKFWLFEVIGGAYLLYLAAAHFLWREEDVHANKTTRFGSGFWGTVISVELADIAFSIDSIVAAVAMAPDHFGYYWKLTIVFTGGILGIVMMRFVAGFFIILLERFHGLAIGAYLLVAWIGVKLVSSGFHAAHYVPAEMNPWLFWGVMLMIVIASMLYQPHGGFWPKKKMMMPKGLVKVGDSGETAPPGGPIGAGP